jgi:hypothetical protein
MKRTGTARILAGIFLGVLLGTYLHFMHMGIIGGGRESYLAKQSVHFDKLVAQHSAFPMLIAGVILAGLAIGVYELIAAGIANVLPPDMTEQ